MYPQNEIVAMQIMVGGTPLDDTIEVIELNVDLALFMPGMFTILLGAGSFEPRDPFAISSKFKFGDEVVIKVGYATTLVPVISGVITGIEAATTSSGINTVLIRGYEECFKLTQGSHIRAFQEVTDSDMVKKIVGERGLSVVADITRTRYKVFIQYNQTDWDFIVERARRNGLLVKTEGKTLKFQKHKKGAAKLALAMGENIIRFEARLSVLGQFSKAIATGWDIRQKKEITGQAQSSGGAPFHSQDPKGSAAIKNVVRGDVQKLLIGQLPLLTQSQATEMAQSSFDLAESQFICGEGVCDGSPNLKAGDTVELKELGGKFSGTYTVTQLRHHLAEGNYTTIFNFNGASPEALPSLLNPEDSFNQNRLPGTVIALVTNNNDPDGMGRVKLKYPWLPVGSAEIESDWARVVIPGGGPERGVFFLPEVDDEVLVAFEFGDFNSPYVLGGLHQGKDAPPVASSELVKNGKIAQRVIKTASGHTIILADEAGQEKITIIDKTKKNSIVIDSTNSSMTLKADGDFTLEARGNVSMKSTAGAVEIESGQAFKIKAGANLDIEATAAAKIKANATMNVEGATTTVKGSAMTEISGGMVKIN